MQSEFKFCPMCATKLETISSEFEHVARNGCPKCKFIDYNNSRPTVSALLVNEKNEVLLVKRSWHPYQGYLDVPGGFLETGEHPFDGLKREIMEELHASIEVPDSVFTFEMDVYEDGENAVQFSGQGAPILNIFFRARIVGEPPRVNDAELAGMGWYPIADLPTLIEKVGFMSNRRALMKLYDLYVKQSA